MGIDNERKPMYDLKRDDVTPDDGPTWLWIVVLIAIPVIVNIVMLVTNKPA